MSLAIPWWLLLVLVVGSVFALKRFYRGFFVGWLLRSAAVLGGILILAKPTLVRETEREVSRKVVVLVDDSGSMQLTDPGEGAPRAAKADAVLDGGLREELEERYSLEEIRFAGGGTTDLSAALQLATGAFARGELAGIVLLSDGRDTTDLEGRGLRSEVAKLKAMGSPVVAVPFGTETAPRDVAVLGISAPEFIYLGDRLKIGAQIKADQTGDEELTVTLERDGGILDTKTINGAG